jgi:hypothetical protein
VDLALIAWNDGSGAVGRRSELCLYEIAGEIIFADSRGGCRYVASFLNSDYSIRMFFFCFYKNVRSDHSHSGRQPRAIRGSLPEAPWLSDVPALSLFTWRGCGGHEFPRTRVAPHPVPASSKLDGIKISVKVVRHKSKINVWKTQECIFAKSQVLQRFTKLDGTWPPLGV